PNETSLAAKLQTEEPETARPNNENLFFNRPLNVANKSVRPGTKMINISKRRPIY
nr:hypothetical protein [Tanacetum cinerariifolium]